MAFTTHMRSYPFLKLIGNLAFIIQLSFMPRSAAAWCRKGKNEIILTSNAILLELDGADLILLHTLVSIQQCRNEMP